MLEANDLRTLLAALRPPAGYELDRAVGTTFSLDLHALVTAPLAFALFDSEAADETAGAAELLESLRRHSDRMDIFCQAGQIALPTQYRPIVAYLETSVHPVTPPNRRLVFHPKLWALRYTRETGPALHRLLVLSRNLTFDRSWDTLLVLDGHQTRAAAVRERNSPLVRFIRQLPKLALTPLSRDRRAAVEALARDLERVDFALPAGFDAVRFWPLGIGRARTSPFAHLPPPGRTLVVSPFLSPRLLHQVGAGGVLVSRAETLDTLSADDLAAFAECRVLSDAASVSDVIENDVNPAAVADETVAEAAGTQLRGLHAKLFVFDCGHRTHLFTGSANATNAAFSGNVEFVAELVGKRSQCGVDVILNGRGGTGFGELLEPYDPDAASAISPDTELARRLEDLRRQIAMQPYAATAEVDDESLGYRVTLRAAGDDVIPEAAAAARCWPITLGESAAIPLTRVWADGGVYVHSAEAITAFYAIELTLREGRQHEQVRFVVRASLEGAPADRLDRLLVQLLRTRGDVFRYMLFLLAGDDNALAALRARPSESGADPLTYDCVEAVDLPLVEGMVRALARTPERIDHLARLITSLQATDEGRLLLPDGLDAVWDAIVEARRATR